MTGRRAPAIEKYYAERNSDILRRLREYLDDGCALSYAVTKVANDMDMSYGTISNVWYRNKRQAKEAGNGKC